MVRNLALVKEPSPKRSGVMTSLLIRLLARLAKLFATQRKGGAFLFSFAAPYLLLISFYGNFNDFTPKKIAEFNNSPYDGDAIPLISSYDTKTYKEADFLPEISTIKHESHKQIWPWVFLNRIVGYNQVSGNALFPERARPFQNIRGMDLENKSGALDGLYVNVRLAALIAKVLGTPGFVLDLEPYNNYKTYDVSNLAEQMGWSKDRTEARLRQVGENLADITADQYPSATVWFTFTGLASRTRTSGKTQEYRSITYIAQGFLQRIKEKGYSMTVVSGGELAGYCYTSIADLRTTNAKRQDDFGAVLESNPSLKLGATIAIWQNGSKRQNGAFRNGKCGTTHANNLTDFEPYISALASTYGFLSIYAAGMTGYDPYNPSIDVDYNKHIVTALSKAKKH